MANEPSFNPFQQEGKDKGKDKKQEVGPDYSAEFIQMSRRIKVIEESVNSLRRKILVNEQNDLNRNKRVLSEEKATQAEINELKKSLENTNRVLRELISELKNVARKEEVEVLRKYIDMWNPIKFVTEETVEEMIKDKIESMKEG